MIGKKFVLPIALAVVLFSGLFAAGTTGTSIQGALCDIQRILSTIIPTIALIMILLAGLVYAAGQAFGAEMKAKAQGWAMSLLVGGILGIVIAVLAPFLITTFLKFGSGVSALSGC